MPVAITPLIISQLPIKRRGLTEFTYSRFLVPWLCGYEGRALFLDADMAVTGDIAELFACGDSSSVQINKDQPKFEWTSAMLFNCAGCAMLTPEYVDDAANKLFDLEWAFSVGEFPSEWNHCVSYEQPRTDAKLYHYTSGLPCWVESSGLPEDEFWLAERDEMSRTCSWADLMLKSVHAQPVIKRMLATRYGLKVA